MQIKVGLGIPTINRLDLLQEALEVYRALWFNNSVYILDNGHQNIPQASWYNLEISKNNKGVAESWNWLIQHLFDDGCTHAVIMNDDIVFDKSPQTIEEFIQKISAGFYKGSRITEDWSVFVIAKSTFELIGPFSDLFYPAYFEDNDYEYRMKLADTLMVTTNFLDPVIFRNSQSIAKNPELNVNFMNNAQKYKEKWGGPPRSETFKTPYNK